MYGWGMGWIGMLVQLLIIAGVIYFIVSLFKKDEKGGGNQDTAEAILRERFARGEISEEEYKRMQEVLKRSHS